MRKKERKREKIYKSNKRMNKEDFDAQNFIYFQQSA